MASTHAVTLKPITLQMHYTLIKSSLNENQTAAASWKHTCLHERDVTDLSVDACSDGADLSRGSVNSKHVGNRDVWRLAQDAIVHQPVCRGAVIGVKGRYLHYRSACRGREVNKRESKH